MDVHSQDCFFGTLLNLSLLLVTALPLAAQIPMDETLLETEVESADPSDLLDELNELQSHPLNINRASFEELQRLPGLSSVAARRILAYRKERGPFESVDRLSQLEGFDAELLDRLRAFITVNDEESARGIVGTSRLRFSRTLERPRGFQDGTYFDSPAKYYQRSRLAFRDRYETGFLSEKDSGEKRWDDFRAFYFKATDPARRYALILGQYRLEVGQGLALWSPYAFSKGPDAVYPSKRRPRGVQPYTFAAENSGLVGGAAMGRLGNFSATIFASKAKRDANLTPSGEVETLLESGLHRNENELRKRDTLSESALGTHLQWAPPMDASLGVTVYTVTYDPPLANSRREEHRFDFRGHRNHLWSFNYDLPLPGGNLFGEIARSKSGGIAALSGIHLSAPRLGVVLLARSYGRDFHSPLGFAFGERTGAPQNERGVYLGVAGRPAGKTVINAYADVFKFPWRTATDPLPTSGVEVFLQAEQPLRRDLRITFRVRQKRQEEFRTFSNSDGRSSRRLVEREQLNLRLQVDFSVVPTLQVRGRAEIIAVNYDGRGQPRLPRQRGFLLYHDVRWTLRSRLTLSTRLTFFDTDSFDSRLYQFENDLPGVLTNQLLYGRGSRWYVLAETRLGRWLAASVKFASTYHDDRTTLGSGPDAIQGQAVHTLGTQVEIHL